MTQPLRSEASDAFDHQDVAAVARWAHASIQHYASEVLQRAEVPSSVPTVLTALSRLAEQADKGRENLAQYTRANFNAVTLALLSASIYAQACASYDGRVPEVGAVGEGEPSPHVTASNLRGLAEGVAKAGVYVAHSVAEHDRLPAHKSFLNGPDGYIAFKSWLTAALANQPPHAKHDALLGARGRGETDKHRLLSCANQSVTVFGDHHKRMLQSAYESALAHPRITPPASGPGVGF